MSNLTESNPDVHARNERLRALKMRYGAEALVACDAGDYVEEARLRALSRQCTLALHGDAKALSTLAAELS